MSYTPPLLAEGPSARLVAGAGTAGERAFVFGERIEIGRRSGGSPPEPGMLQIDDPTVSSHHCTVSRHPDGRFFIRDTSRNGTRVDGRRLMPNLEVEVAGGQTITVGRGVELVLQAQAAGRAAASTQAIPTLAAPETRTATVLVGDIRDFTVLVRTTPSEALQRSVTRVFEELERDVVRLKGTVKEYQGDSLLAFWEAAAPETCAASACSAALALAGRVRQLATDPSVWRIETAPLAMDWALSTGEVVLNSFGARGPAGLSLVGEAVVRAYRIEKFADTSTGPIVACSGTQAAAAERFRFRDLGERTAKGFDRAERVFALEGEHGDDAKTAPIRPLGGAS